MTCPYKPNCQYQTEDTLCNERYDLCKIRRKLKETRTRLSNSGIEEEVLAMIELGGMVR